MTLEAGIGKRSQAIPHPTTHRSRRIPGQVTVCHNQSGPDPAPTPPTGVQRSIARAHAHLRSCRAFLFFLRFSSSMGYSLNRSRPSRISPTGTADTSIFNVKFTSLGWEQPRVWYPAKLGTERYLQAKETEFVGEELVPAGRGAEPQWDLDPPISLPALGKQGCSDAEVQGWLPTLPALSAPMQELTLS